MFAVAAPRNLARAWTVAGADDVTVAATLPRPVTAAPPAERLTVGHDADRLTMDASLMASSLPARVAARHATACTRAFALLCKARTAGRSSYFLTLSRELVQKGARRRAAPLRQRTGGRDRG